MGHMKRLNAEFHEEKTESKKTEVKLQNQ
jgi:hypothetical protein